VTHSEVTIVGGGLGGLTAAVRAAETGWSVHLYEAHDRLGGRAHTSDGPYRANWGPHVVYSDGPLWRWLVARGLTGGAHAAPRTARLLVRYDGTSRRLPPLPVIRALWVLRRASAPIDRSFRDWAGELVGPSAAERIGAFMGVVAFDHDPARLSAEFVRDRLVRATSFPPTVRYLPGGWSTMIDRLAQRARELGVRIATNSPVDTLADGPTILAVPIGAATRLLGAAPTGALEGTTTALLDLGLGRRRRDPYVLSDLDAPGFCETFTVPDPSLAPAGHHLVQTQTGMRPGETLDDAVARLEALVDSAFVDWRGRETWRRRARIVDETGALDLPGYTWRDRPTVRQADGVWLVNDRVAAPGLLSEVSHHAALVAVEELGVPTRPRAQLPVAHGT
jgi:phytoene dehydrogenase-like protein